MRIMFVNQSFQIGGVEKQIFAMAKEFARLKNTEVSIFLLSKKGGFDENIDTELQSKITYSDIKLIEKQPLKPILRAVSVIRAAKRFKPDIIYARVMPLPCTIAGKFLGIPVVVVEINNPSKSIERVNPAPLRLQTFLVRKISRKLATRIVANSSRLADEAKKYWKLKTRPSVIYNGLDLKNIKEKSMEPTNLPWTDGKPIPLVVSTGRIVPSKGFGDLIEAFALVRKDTKARLVIIGGRNKKGEKEKLLAKVDRLKLGECVWFAGERANPYPFMKAADIYVSSSLYEGFSNSLLEALALGLPTVSTDHKFGANEMIENGKSGILVPVSDPKAMAEAILQILEDGELQKTLSYNAQERAQNFTIQKTVSEYEKLFREVVRV